MIGWNTPSLVGPRALKLASESVAPLPVAATPTRFLPVAGSRTGEPKVFPGAMKVRNCGWSSWN